MKIVTNSSQTGYSHNMKLHDHLDTPRIQQITNENLRHVDQHLAIKPFQKHKSRPINKGRTGSRRTYIHQAITYAFPEAPVFLLLLLNGFSLQDPTLLAFFPISLSFERHPIVLSNPGSSTSKLTRKSQSFVTKRAPGTGAKAPEATTYHPHKPIIGHT